MRVVYEAENIIDAHLVKGLLEQAGIVAFVLGEHLSGGIGELPTMGMVSVGVADSDAEGAAAALQDWRDAAPAASDAVAADLLPHPAT
ncbi:DUF2007 domain-containing protein [Chiayiivirga flava]|uniref:DUF2007 domain-containing protein n=1 Tax=Chiayiivirga flava TaxID=659595 RepID=A0A7W8D7U0_9GAMM|nr:DUF2007 domain-containing protein [Chiayiivirga flava]MBB5209470.1 hypothetical protein [Chiayiivirga flava]